MAFLTIYKVSFLIAEGLPIGVVIYRPAICRLSIGRDCSRASCMACYGVSYGQYRWYSGNCGSCGGIAGRSCGACGLV